MIWVHTIKKLIKAITYSSAVAPLPSGPRGEHFFILSVVFAATTFCSRCTFSYAFARATCSGSAGTRSAGNLGVSTK